MKLIKSHILRGKIQCVTGLHIGSTSDVMEIGGIDNPVIKHPISGEPYVPGSSLKGKMRSQMEKREGKITSYGEPCGCGKDDCMVCRLFGAHKNTRHNLGPTRIIVRDANLSDESREEMKSAIVDKGVSYIEIKTENTINRKVGTALNPRIQERVPSGAKFDMEIVIQEFDLDNGKDLVGYVKKALKAVEESYLGGSGSRGSGQVKFTELKLDGEAISL